MLAAMYHAREVPFFRWNLTFGSWNRSFILFYNLALARCLQWWGVEFRLECPIMAAMALCIIRFGWARAGARIECVSQSSQASKAVPRAYCRQTATSWKVQTISCPSSSSVVAHLWEWFEKLGMASQFVTLCCHTKQCINECLFVCDGKISLYRSAHPYSALGK